MNNPNIKTSSIGFYYSFLKPLSDGFKLTKEIDRLLDIWDSHEYDDAKRNQAYSKAVHLAKKQAKLMGYTS